MGIMGRMEIMMGFEAGPTIHNSHYSHKSHSFPILLDCPASVPEDGDDGAGCEDGDTDQPTPVSGGGVFDSFGLLD